MHHYKIEMCTLRLQTGALWALFKMPIDSFSIYYHFFSCDHAAIRTVISVCLSVCLSVTPFSQCSSHHIIMKFSGVITNDRSDVHAKGQRSKVKVTEVMTPFSRFRTVTPVWNDAWTLMLLRRGALLFFKVIRQIIRSHGTINHPFFTRIESFRTVTWVWIHRWLWNGGQSLKQRRRGALLFF